ncbi:hypothetical protein BH18ACT9_BH18ACT9_21700 [soil metagenome]
MQKAVSDASVSKGWTHAGLGVLMALVGGLLLAQAGGSDRELFLSLGYALGAAGLLGIVIGGVAIGVQLARD